MRDIEPPWVHGPPDVEEHHEDCECEDCAWYCAFCGEFFSVDQEPHREGGDFLCDECWEETNEEGE